MEASRDIIVLLKARKHRYGEEASASISKVNNLRRMSTKMMTERVQLQEVCLHVIVRHSFAKPPNKVRFISVSAETPVREFVNSKIV